MTFTVRAQLGSAEGPEEHEVSVAPYSSCLATAERFIGLSAGLSFGEELFYLCTEILPYKRIITGDNTKVMEKVQRDCSATNWTLGE